MIEDRQAMSQIFTTQRGGDVVCSCEAAKKQEEHSCLYSRPRSLVEPAISLYLETPGRVYHVLAGNFKDGTLFCREMT